MRTRHPQRPETLGESFFRPDKHDKKLEKDSLGPSGTYEFINCLVTKTIIFLMLTVKCLKVFPAGKGHLFKWF